MLKIKDSVDLKELEKKYKKVIEFEEDWYDMYFNIDPKTRKVCINCSDSYYSGEANARAEILYDLIEAGLVEKV